MAASGARAGNLVLRLAVLGATLFVWCNPLFGIHEGQPPPRCADPNLIDDMEDGDGAICEVNGRHGYWYSVGDGTGTITPGEGFQMTPINDGERGTSLYAARVTGSGFTNWGALMGFNFNQQGEGKIPYDASGPGGIVFWMKSNVAVSVEFLTVPTVQTAFAGDCVRTDHDCDNPFSFKITAPSGDWTRYRVPFSALRQLNGSVAWNPSQLLAIHFRVPPGAAFDVWVDDLWFDYSCTTDECLPTCKDPDREHSCAMIRDFPAACRPMEVDCSTGVGTCGDPLMIDNMEDEEPDICATNGRIGTWFAGGDGTGTDLIPAPGRFFAPTLIPGGRGASHFAARRSGTGFTKWGASMGLQFNDADVGLQPYDASAFSGVKFWMKSMSTVHVAFPIVETIQTAYDGTCEDGPTTINCANHFTYALPASSDWVEYEVPFGALRQEAFFDAQANLRTGSATFAPSHLVEIVFRCLSSCRRLWLDLPCVGSRLHHRPKEIRSYRGLG